MAGEDQFGDRVEAVLRGELGKVLSAVGNEAYNAGVSGYEPEFPVRGLNVVRAFESVGLLSPDQASSWREAFERASRPLPVVGISADLRGRVDAYLGSLLAAARAPSDPTNAFVGAQTAWNDLRAAGVIDDEEVADWMRRLRGEPAAGSATASPRPFVTPVPLDRPVRSILGPEGRRRGLRVVAVDLFEGGVCVRFHLKRRGRDRDGSFRPLPDEIEPGALLAPRHAMVSLADDVGTNYVMRGGGGRIERTIDEPLTHDYVHCARPAVPQQARLLRIGWADIAFGVPL